jgi:hypothetical protein
MARFAEGRIDPSPFYCFTTIGFEARPLFLVACPAAKRSMISKKMQWFGSGSKRPIAKVNRGNIVSFH